MIHCQQRRLPIQAVFVEFEGKPDPSLPIPVVIADPIDQDYRWAYGLVVHVIGIDSEAVFKAIEALKKFQARRIFGHYRETPVGLLWDSEIDA